MKNLIKPKELCIDCNANCQLRCPECPTTGSNASKFAGFGYLHFNDFKNLIDNNPYILLTQFQNRGELFLNPELLEIMKYAYYKKVALYCDSGVNLNIVNDKVAEGLAKYRFRSILCSIDGASNETYQIYRKGGNFDKVIENIKRINYFKRKYNSKFPILSWQFVVFGHNEHEIPKARNLANNLNMDFSTKMAWNSLYSPIRDKKFVELQTNWANTTREDVENKDNTHYVRHVCYSLWHSPKINWDGKVIGCCWNSWGEFGGNAFKDEYISCINNENINYARGMLLGNYNLKNGLPCSTCPMYIKMKDKNQYLNIDEISRYNPFWYRIARFTYLKLSLRRI